MLPILSEGVGNFLFDGIETDGEEVAKQSIKSGVKCSKSSVGDYLSSGRWRERLSSRSSGRSRFIESDSIISVIMFTN